MKKIRLFEPILLTSFLGIILLACATDKKVFNKDVDHATIPSNGQEKQIDSLFSSFTKNGSPGVAVLIMRNDSVLLLKNYGLANLEYGVAIDSSSTFHIASVSKQFTAFAIALLAERGKLSLTDNINRYLDSFPQYQVPITIQNLISHTSGLREQLDLMALAGYRSEDLISSERIMRLIRNQKSLNFEPGTEFQYSNTNYTLLAKIVEKITHESFSSWTRKNIFTPLQMHNTFFYDDLERIVKNRSYSYQYFQDSFRKSTLNYEITGSTGLFTCTTDLINWIENFDKPVVGNQETLLLMNKTGELKDGHKISYAFGQDTKKYRGLSLIYHPGADAGYRAYIGRFPSEKFVVTILSNLASTNAEELSMRIADIYLFKSNFLKPDVSKPSLVEEKKFSKVDDAILERYIGSYQIYPNIALTIKLDSNQLKGQFTGKKTWHLLRSTSDINFIIDALKIEIEFENTGRKAGQLTFSKDGKITSANRIYSSSLDTKNLQQYTGNYFSDETSTLCSITKVGDHLIVGQLRNDDIRLNPLEKDHFETNAWYFKNIMFIRNSDNKITGFDITTDKERVRKLSFKKIENIIK
jgi:CubicO group peptidase (beta-lactamase class C family)